MSEETKIGTISLQRSVEISGSKIVLSADLDYGAIECAGIVFKSSVELRKRLIQEDIDNPIPADDEYILHEEFNGNGKSMGKIRMTYLEKLEIWDFMDKHQRKLQLTPVRDRYRTTIEIDGEVYECNKVGKSAAAREQAKKLTRGMSNDKFMAKNGFRAKKKR